MQAQIKTVTLAGEEKLRANKELVDIILENFNWLIGLLDTSKGQYLSLEYEI